jgi:hypothetical protein
MNDSNRGPEPPPHGQDQAPQRQQGGQQQVYGPLDSLTEPTLAVDLAAMDLDRAIVTAHKYPRNIDIFVRKIRQMALYDEAAAERCVYMLPRAGKAIVGPSIGFANLLASAWGNCRDRGEWIRTDRHEKVVVCEGVFLDLETNRTTYAPSVRRISGSSGQLYSADMIAVTAQAGSSIGRRNAILNGVLRPLWWPVYEEALVVVRGTEATLGERRAKMVAAFAGFGIEPKRVFMALGVRGEGEITLDHIVMLRGMFEALREQSITPEEMFDPRRMTGAEFDKVDNPLGDDEADETAGMGQGGPKPASGGAMQTGAPQQQGGQPAAQAPAAQAPAATAGATEAKPKSNRGRPSNAAKAAKAAAEQSGGAPAQSPEAPGGEGGQPRPETAAPPASASQQQAPKPEPAPPADKPRDAATYEAHLRTWLAACTSPSEVDDRWRQKGERDLRGECSIIEDDFERMKRLKDDRIAELKKG